MHYIKSIPHYVYAMYHDITKYKFVRDKFLGFLGFIALSWVISFIMFKGIESTDGYFLNPLFVPVMMTIGFVISWVIGYYNNIYPMISKWHKEWQLQDKYPYLYNKFIEEERNK